MRRFAFVDIDLPGSNDYSGLITRWLKAYVEPEINRVVPPGDGVMDHPALSPLKTRLEEILKQEGNPLMQRRAIGPAITKDMISYIGQRCQDTLKDGQPGGLDPQLAELVCEAFTLFIVPQLDGLDYEGIRAIYEQVEGPLFQGVAFQENILKRIRQLYPHIHRWSG